MDCLKNTDKSYYPSYKNGISVDNTMNAEYTMDPWDHAWNMPGSSYGPIDTAGIGPEGGSLEVYGNILTIPEGALPQVTEISFGLVWNGPLQPKIRTTETTLSATVVCLPSGLKFAKPAVITMPHCLEIDQTMINRIRPVLYSTHNHTLNDVPKWTRSRLGDDRFHITSKTVDLKVHDFCLFKFVLDDGSEVMAKKIRIVPFATPISYGEDQNIRIHIFDDLEGAKEKIKKEEEELGGKRLAVYTPYVFRQNCGNLIINPTWFTPGWNLCSPQGEIPFSSMWAFDHNSIELHLTNTTQMDRFHCNLQIQQDNNPDVVTPAFSHHVQIRDPAGGLLSPVKPEEVEDRQDISLGPIQESTPVRSPFCLDLPEVPPPPAIDYSLMSSMPKSPVDPKQVAIPQENAVLPGHLDVPGHSNRVALAQYIIQTQFNVNQGGNDYCSNFQQHIIPLKLKRDLSQLLDRDFDQGNWVHLAKVLNVEDVSEKIQNEKNKAAIILMIAEERGIIKSRDFLRRVFEEELKRDDCVELLDKYDEGKVRSTTVKRPLKSNNSSEGSFEEMDCQESPNGDAESPDFSHGAGPGFLPVAYPPAFEETVKTAMSTVTEVCQGQSFQGRILQLHRAPGGQGSIWRNYQSIAASKNSVTSTSVDVQNAMGGERSNQVTSSSNQQGGRLECVLDKNKNVSPTLPKKLPNKNKSHSMGLPSTAGVADKYTSKK